MSYITEKLAELKGDFAAVYGAEPEVSVFAPGRVNLIGEHTDYNGGYVFPCALDCGIIAVGKKRDDMLIKAYSANVPKQGILTSDLTALKADPAGHFNKYIEGCAWAMREAGYAPLSGFDILVWGNVPNGSGLSSSAALEVSVCLLIRKLFGYDGPAMPELAEIARSAECDYLGMRCGIMDQFISANGKAGHALLLNTGTMDYKHIPLELGDAEFIIVNSRVKHSLVDSEYNTRREQCEEALEEIRAAMQADASLLPASGGLPEALCSLTEEDFEKVSSCIKDEIVRKRAEHAVYENRRTIRAAADLSAGNIEAFGKAMTDSHKSLQYKYEVSCPEMDFLADTANALDYVYGSRMTGGGFGGCTVNLIKKGYAEEFKKTIAAAYEKKVGKTPFFYDAVPGDGAEVL